MNSFLENGKTNKKKLETFFHFKIHTFDAATASSVITFGTNGVTITFSVEIAIDSRSLVEYSSKEKT